MFYRSKVLKAISSFTIFTINLSFLVKFLGTILNYSTGFFFYALEFYWWFSWCPISFFALMNGSIDEKPRLVEIKKGILLLEITMVHPKASDHDAFDL